MFQYYYVSESGDSLADLKYTEKKQKQKVGAELTCYLVKSHYINFILPIKKFLFFFVFF